MTFTTRRPSGTGARRTGCEPPAAHERERHAMTDTLAPVRPGKLIIGGEAVDSASGRTYTTWNPATEAAICEVALAGPEDVDRAVRAARAAFDEGPWPRMRPAERQRLPG